MEDMHLGIAWRSRAARFLLDYRVVVIALWLALTAAAGAFAARIDFDFTPEAVFVGQDDLVDFAEQVKRKFGFEDAVVLLLLESTGPEDVLTPAALTWQHDVCDSVAALPEVERVDGLGRLETLRFRLFRPFVYPMRLVDHSPVDAALAAAVRGWVDRSPLAEQDLVSRDRKAALLAIRVRDAHRGASAMAPVLRKLEEAVAAHPAPAGFKLHWNGIPAMRVDIVRGLEKDQRFLLPCSAALFFFLLVVIFRRLSISLLALAAVLTGLAWTLAVMVAGGWHLNIISNILPVLLVVIGVSNVTHVVSRYAEECDRPGVDRRTAAEGALAHAMLSCAMTYSTTAVGFLSLVFARSLVLQELGWQAGLGMLFLYLSTLGVLGPCFPWFRPPRHRPEGDRAEVVPLSRWTLALGRSVIGAPGAWLAGSAAVCGLALFWASTTRINSTVSETYDEQYAFKQSMNLLERQFGGFLPLEAILQTDDPKLWGTAETVRRVDQFDAWLRTQPEVGLVRSYADFHYEIESRRKRPAAPGEKPEAAPVAVGPLAPRGDLTPQQQELRVQRRQQMLEEFSEVFQLRQFLSADGRWARVLIRLKDVGSRQTIDLIARVESKAREIFPPESGIRVRLSGDAFVNSIALDRFIWDLFGSLIGASVIIFGLIGLLLWSWKLGLVAVAPNIAPLIVTLGYLGLRGYDLNVAHVIVLSISLGVAVDDTVHFLLRYEEEFARDGNVKAAIERSYAGTGRAMVLTSVLIVTGLSVLLFSEFLPTRRFAELTIVTMTAALAGDLVVLQSILCLTQRDRPELAQGRVDAAATPDAEGRSSSPATPTAA